MINSGTIQILRKIVVQMGCDFVCQNPNIFASAILDMCPPDDVKLLTNTLRASYSGKLMGYFRDGSNDMATWVQQKAYFLDESGMSEANTDDVLDALWQAMGWNRPKPTQSKPAKAESKHGEEQVDPSRVSTAAATEQRNPQAIDFASVSDVQKLIQLAQTRPNNRELLLKIGNCYYNGQGITQDYAEAVRWYKKAADQGNSVAQNNLGWCYLNGYGVQQNDGEAIKYFRLAAEQRECYAQNNLGSCYEKGRGLRQDYGEAVKYYRLAADQGNSVAQKNLGLCYEYGRGVRQDYGEAVKFYQLAADQGNSHALNNLARCYLQGRGIQQNDGEAIKYFRLAAEQRESYAQNNLGWCYEYGRGVRQDYNQAVKYYQLAADQGNSLAQYNLGRCYEAGIGVTKDERKATDYYQKAANQGNNDAANKLMEMKHKNEEQSNRVLANSFAHKDIRGDDSNMNWNDSKQTCNNKRKVCSNCKEDYIEGDKYCRFCGAPMGKPDYIDEVFACIYGPPPTARVHKCSKCGYEWTTELMVDEQRWCPKCGGDAPWW